MDINSTLDSIGKSYYELCLLDHKEKSDDELKDIILTNQKMVLAMPLNADLSQLIEGEKWVAEQKACNKILAQRSEKKKKDEKRQANIAAAKKEWEKSLELRRQKAIINLPYAVTYEAQLVIAILEDEGPKKSDEIAEWDDTLSKMEKSKFNNLLNELVKEGILFRNSDDVYCVLNVCTESLFPTDPMKWARIIFSNKNEHINYKQEKIITMLQNEKAPLSYEEIENEVLYFDGSLDQLVDFKILEKHKISKEKMYMYYFTMLGEDTRRENK